MGMLGEVSSLLKEIQGEQDTTMDNWPKLSAYLQKWLEESGRSVDEVAKATRIPVKSIQSLLDGFFPEQGFFAEGVEKLIRHFGRTGEFDASDFLDLTGQDPTLLFPSDELPPQKKSPQRNERG